GVRAEWYGRAMSAPLPLEGIRVLDFTHALAGPYCTLLLGDLGADVVKVEPPEGDQSRRWGPPFVNGESSYFLSVNRNKRSVVLDLKNEQGRQRALRLAMSSDVVVENFRPGTAARLGFGPEDLRRRRPELVYASISGYGQARPDLVGYDQIAQGTSGFMSLTGPADELARDPRFQTNARRQEVKVELAREIERRLAARPSAEWLQRLEAAAIPAGPIHDLKAAFESPPATDREMKIGVDHPTAGPVAQVGAPWKLDGTSTPVRRPPPLLGQHTEEVLRDLTR